MTPKTCTAILKRDGRVVGESTFTLDDAVAAGLGQKKNYQTYPARMLWARASTNVIRDWAPSVAVGLVTEEEVDAEQPDAIDGDYVEMDTAAQYEAEQAILADAEALAADQEPPERYASEAAERIAAQEAAQTGGA
jgi:hypothetical protein